MPQSTKTGRIRKSLRKRRDLKRAEGTLIRKHPTTQSLLYPLIHSHRKIRLAMKFSLDSMAVRNPYNFWDFCKSLATLGLGHGTSTIDSLRQIDFNLFQSNWKLIGFAIKFYRNRMKTSALDGFSCASNTMDLFFHKIIRLS